MSKEIPHATEVGCTDRQRGDIYFIHPSSTPLSMDKDYQVKVPALGQPHPQYSLQLQKRSCIQTARKLYFSFKW